MGITTIIWAIIVFCILIFVHELGHFSVAKAVGIKVHEFALGMGPQIFSFKKGETQYSLRAFPIGGYVKMEGEDEESNDERGFNNKPGWAKAFVIISGSAMNYFLAVIILIAILFSTGFQSTTIQETVQGAPAMQAGILAGDTIIAVNGEETGTWNEIVTAISNTDGQNIAFKVDRNGTILSITSAVTKEEGTGRTIVGIIPTREKDALNSIKYGFFSTFDISYQMVAYLGKLVTGQGSVNDLVGPVGIVSVVGDYAKMGFIYLAQLTALISLNLAIINMLPLPALDGGRLLFMVIEAVTRKKISDEIQGKIHFVGFMLLIFLMIVVTFKDVNVFILK